MRINAYKSEFHALQSSGIQFSLPVFLDMRNIEMKRNFAITSGH